MTQGRPSVGVLGLGNVLQGDDGVGPYAIRVLDSGYDFPPEVRLRDLGTPGPEFVGYLLELEAAIVIDSVHAAGAPGELRIYDRDEILAAGAPERLSPHDPGLREALLTADFAGAGPSSVSLVGVIPSSTELGTELTPQVRDAVPAVCAAVLQRLAELGFVPRQSEETVEPGHWWVRQEAR